MALKCNLYQDNRENSVTKGFYYARAENDAPMSINELAEHMSDHNTPYSKGVIKGILTDMVHCIRELALQGHPVKLDDLAIIKCAVQSKGVVSPKDASLATMVKTIKLTAVATGEFSRAELNKDGKLSWTSLAKKVIEDAGGSTEEGGGGGDAPAEP